MLCKKGGFVTLRDNKLRNVTATLLSDVCKDIKLQPSFLTLNREIQTTRKRVKTNDEVQLDICPRGVWVIGQKALFDIRFFDPNARRFSKQTLKQCYSLIENEKKRHCNTRIIKVVLHH